MSIEVRIPKEITEYKEKIMFGLSIRQLVCLVIAVLIGLGSFFLFTSVFGLSTDLASYIIIIEVMPLFAVGFVRKNGMNFERYFALFLRQKTGIHQRTYKTEININAESKAETEKVGKYDWIFRKDEKDSRNNKSYRDFFGGTGRKLEYERYESTARNRSAKGKAAEREIKVARQGSGATSAGNKKEV